MKKFEGIPIHNRPLGGHKEASYNFFDVHNLSGSTSLKSHFNWLRGGRFRPYLVRGKLGGLHIYIKGKSRRSLRLGF
jgi:hypothetical protein